MSLKNLFKSGFFKDISFLTFSSISSRIILFIRDFYLASTLGPNLYGVWVQILIIINYLLHLPLGFQHLASREIPFYEGSNQKSKIEGIQNLAVSISLISFAVYLIVFFLFGDKLFKEKLDELSLVLILILSFLFVFNAILSIFIRAIQKFWLFSLGSIIQAVIALILMFILVPIMEINGVLVSFSIALFFVSCLWYKHLSYRLRFFAFTFKQFTSKLKISFNLFIVSLINTLIISIDRLIVVYFYESESVGYYGFAFILSQGIFLIISPINQALLPQISKTYGLDSRHQNLESYFYILTKYLGWGVITFSGIIYIMSDPLVSYFMPEYIEALPIIRIVLLGSVFLAMANGASSFLITVQKQNKVLMLQLKIIPFQISTILISSYFQLDLVYIASLMIFFSASYSFYSILECLRLFETNLRQFYKSLISVYTLPLSICVFLILLYYINLNEDLFLDVILRMSLYIFFSISIIYMNRIPLLKLYRKIKY